jgi:hypothetical protein
MIYMLLLDKNDDAVDGKFVSTSHQQKHTYL